MIGPPTITGQRVGVVAVIVLALGALTGAYAATPASAAAGSLSGTPCVATALVCVDLYTQKAWLAKGGVVTAGPFLIASGGLQRETPMGTFHVLNKVQDYASKEYPLPDGQPAPMPWAVFFEPGGIAFHAGDPNQASSGCIHLADPIAQTFFHTLNVGDEVQVVMSGNGHKGGFYKIHHQKPPTSEQLKIGALEHENALRKEQGLPPLPTPT